MHWYWNPSTEHLQGTYRIRGRLIPKALIDKAGTYPSPVLNLFRPFHWLIYCLPSNLDRMAGHYSLEKSLGPTPENSSSLYIAYLLLIMPYSDIPGAPFFDRQNITHFLDLYDQLCSDYCLSESEKIYWLWWYCEFFIRKYIKILIKRADWATVRSVLRKEYKDDDFDQLMNSLEFLEALKKKSPVPKTMIFCITATYLPRFLGA